MMMNPATYKILTREEAAFICKGDTPVLVLSDRVRGLVPWLIRGHTDGYYNHAMWSHNPGMFATQEWRFRERLASDFVQGDYRLKFWMSFDWGVAVRAQMMARIREQILARGRYDWLGILGQAICVKRLNLPGRAYCSEAAADVLRQADPLFRMDHPSPADINRWCKDRSSMVCLGVYDPDCPE